MLRGKGGRVDGYHVLGDSSVMGSGEVIRASVPYTLGWGSFVLVKWTA